MELAKRTAKIEMTVLAKDGIEVRTLRHVKTRAIEPTEPIYELEITGKTEAENGNETYETRRYQTYENQTYETRVRERGLFCNNFPWDQAEANMRNYIFLCRGRRSKAATTKTPWTRDTYNINLRVDPDIEYWKTFCHNKLASRAHKIYTTTRKRNPGGYPKSKRGRGFGRGGQNFQRRNSHNQSKIMQNSSENQKKLLQLRWSFRPQSPTIASG